MQQRSTLCDFAQLFTQYVARSGAKYSELAQKTQISRHTLYRWRDGKCRQPDKARLRRCFKPLKLTEAEANKLLLAAGYSPDNLFPALYQQPLLSKEEPLSPFVVGPPITQPQQFYGRHQETRRILKLWQRFPLSNVAIFGQQRSGKTSFLYYLRHQLYSYWIQLPKTSLNYRIILIDFKDARMQYPTSLLAYLLKQLHLPVPEPCHLLNFAETVDNQPLDKPTIILMDDIDVGLNAKALDQTFWWGLYHFMNNMAGRVAFLLTAHPDSSQLLQEKAKTLSFFNTFSHHLTLGSLLPEEAEALIERAPLAFSAKDKAWIMKHSANWPALLQILCERRLNALEEGDNSDTWKKNFLYTVE